MRFIDLSHVMLFVVLCTESIILNHNLFHGSFEHSLVDELGYTGYATLRSAFNNAFGGEDKVPIFDVVVDAGCGTGLVGEQVRCNMLRCIVSVNGHSINTTFRHNLMNITPI
jgi:hypothetical protein